VSTLALLDQDDLPWVAEVVDVVAAAAGKPWRIALDRLDDTRRAEQPRAPVRFAAVVAAVQRLLGGRARNTALARAARALTLGRPALTAAERQARIGFAASQLELTCAAVEALLWSDLPRERPVELPHGRPSEVQVAATANVHLLQRAMLRAQAVTLRVWGDAGPLIHATGARGLLATLTRGDSGETRLDIVGPLALFHRTAVYGRALAQLVPLLAGCSRFELEIVARAHDRLYVARVASPVLLPPVPARLALPSPALLRLTRELARVARDVVVAPHPPTIAAGEALACPDLLLEHRGRRLRVELIGFWTVEFLQRRLAVYREAGVAEVVFCIDETRGCTRDELPPELPIVRYTPRMTATARELADRVMQPLPARLAGARAPRVCSRPS
jgi:hypothetical protein